MYAGLREVGRRADLALLLSDREAVVAAGTPSPSTNGARPSRVRVGYRPTAQAVLITAGREESEAGAVLGASGVPRELLGQMALAAQAGAGMPGVRTSSTQLII